THDAHTEDKDGHVHGKAENEDANELQPFVGFLYFSVLPLNGVDLVSLQDIFYVAFGQAAGAEILLHQGVANRGPEAVELTEVGDRGGRVCQRVLVQSFAIEPDERVDLLGIYLFLQRTTFLFGNVITD